MRATLGSVVDLAPAASIPLLRVSDLTVYLHTNSNQRIRPLNNVSFHVASGETVGVLGESGAGKTTLAMAILRLLPIAHSVIEGSIEFDGVSLLGLHDRELRKVRGSKISLVYQDASVLNPVLRVGDQIVEVLRAHREWSRQQYRDRAMSLLKDVELRDEERIYAAYPHQLSGGQRQRVLIAQALACEPALVIADEPTASLDRSTTSEILSLLDRLKQRFHTAFLLISHDLSVLADRSDRILVMYAGRIVEQGSRDEVFKHSRHPYSNALFSCALPMQKATNRENGKRRLLTIAGSPPDPSLATIGCDFESRCPDRMKICGLRDPGEMRVSNTHAVRCFKLGGVNDAGGG
jgi:oligopeptide/dipeptide ABC transporter ATP-binding protein